jgi:hypothetical protein
MKPANISEIISIESYLITLVKVSGGEMRKAGLLLFSTFLLIAPLAAQTVTVSLPSGGDVAMGSLMQIAWTSTGVSGGFRIQLIRPGGGLVGLLMPNVAGSPQSWTVAAPALVGEQYRIRVRALNDSATGESAVFTVTSGDPVDPGGKPTLRLQSPNGGETWPSGGMRSITWTTANWSGNVQLSLHQNGVSKGIIAKSLSSAQGSYPWAVGTTDKGLAAAGGGYSVLISRIYSDMKPHAALADKSDGDFAIGFPAPDQTAPLAENIQVSVPEDGRVFEYGTDFCINKGRCVSVPIQWVAGGKGPFQVDLMEGGNVNMPLAVTDLQASGTTHSAKFLFTTQNSKQGWYRIRVRSTDGKTGGLSGKFQLKFRLWNIEIAPSIKNRFFYQNPEGSVAFVNIITTKYCPDIPGFSRVGFFNSINSPTTRGGYKIYYNGVIFRSRIIFDLSQFQKLKGHFVMAKLLVIKHTQGAHVVRGVNPMDPADCDVRFFILAEPWPGADFFAIPGNLIQNFPGGAPNYFDIPEWAAAWARGASPNYGMLLVGAMEKMNHDNQDCINYYKIHLQVQFQEEE